MPPASASGEQRTEWAASTTELEAALLGGVLMTPDKAGPALSAGLEAVHFLDEGLGLLWERIRAVAMRGDAIDLRSVLQGGIGTMFGAGVSFYEAQAQLLGIAAHPAVFGQYARNIKANWALRRIADMGDNVRSTALTMDAIQLVEQSLSHLDEVREVTLDRKGTRRGTAASIAKTLATDVRGMMSGDIVRPPGTGLVTLDRHLPSRGLAPGSLIVLAGRTGMGKTMVASSIAGKVSRAGHGVAFFSLEVPSSEIIARIIAERIGGKSPSYGDILAGHVAESDLDMIEWERDQFDGVPLLIDDTPALSIADMMVSCRREAARLECEGKRLRLVVIDHCQIVKPPNRYQGNRVNELGEIANGAKVLAKQLGCAVILGCQVNRASEGRDEKRPTLADLRASGEIEEAADAVLMLYREAYYILNSKKYRDRDGEALNEYQRTQNLVEIGIEKARQGSTGRVTLWCDPARSIVVDMMGNAA
ncbi:replicative DNA helicase [Bosea lathyri]|uniref:Replicative DNA helicase n=1 Tax=Bosea lathyri TaxID=1036778 RepID=A0A1H6BLF5_9HYPH|nr:DnaB-like helicase C-terminal domain-containing protein [Bosea lathyri]SEG61217.1 replicative DNA helicase [Bosea lathyri]